MQYIPRIQTEFDLPVILAALVIFLSYSPRGNAEFHATLTAATNYFFRGYSKSDNDFVLQTNLDYEHSSGFYMGTSVSNVDFGDDPFDDPANVEIAPYLGWTFKLTDDWRLDTQWVRYFYDGEIFDQHSDYNEFYFLLHYQDIFSASASFSEDYYNQGKASGNFELTGRYPITDALEISTSMGYSLTKKVLEYDYLYWDLGLTLYYKFVAIDVRYVDALETSDAFETTWQYSPVIANPSYVFSISIGF